MTAAAARKWAEIYPDLFAKSKNVGKGLIQLNADIVNDFIAGQDEETDAVIDNKIN
jgi:hypothetical protein